MSDSAGGREARRAHFLVPQAQRRKGRLPRPAIAAVIAVVALGAVAIALIAPRLGLFGARAQAATRGHAPYPVVTPLEGRIELAVSTFADGKAHFYTCVQQGQPLEFFVLQAPDGSLHAAFNACEVCFPYGLGYRQQGGVMVCNKCDLSFPAERIGEVSGECDPAPLPFTVRGGSVAIQVNELLQGVRLFATTAGQR